MHVAYAHQALAYQLFGEWVGSAVVVRKQIPMDKMRERAQAYVDAGLITDEVAQRIISVILSERNHEECFFQHFRPMQ